MKPSQNCVFDEVKVCMYNQKQAILLKILWQNNLHRNSKIYWFILLLEPVLNGPAPARINIYEFTVWFFNILAPSSINQYSPLIPGTRRVSTWCCRLTGTCSTRICSPTGAWTWFLCTGCWAGSSTPGASRTTTTSGTFPPNRSVLNKELPFT